MVVLESRELVGRAVHIRSNRASFDSGSSWGSSISAVCTFVQVNNPFTIKLSSAHIGWIVVTPSGLAAVGGAPLGVDVEAVGTGGESSDGPADSQGRQVGSLFQFQATANSVSYT